MFRLSVRSLFFVLGFTFLSLFVPKTLFAQDTAYPLPADQSVVEYWTGYGDLSGTWYNGDIIGGRWLEPGEAKANAGVIYDFQVHADDSIAGTITLHWSGTTSLPEPAKAACNAAPAENYGYWGTNCSLAPPPSSGTLVFPVTGTRTRDKSTGELTFAFRYKYDNYIWEVLSGYNDEANFQWTFRRPSDVMNVLSKALMSVKGIPEPNWARAIISFDGSGEYTHAPQVTGQNVFYKHEQWSYLANLVETGGRPSLGLDKELLERSVFMNGVPVDNALTANIGWHTVDGGSTSWQIVGDSETTPVSTATSIPRTVDVGDLGVGQHEAEVQGKDTLNRTSQIQNVLLQVAPYFDKCPNYTVSKLGKVVSYKCGISIPTPSFKAKVEGLPAWVPFFGGADLGIGETQISGELEVRSSGDGSIKGEAKTSFEAMEKTIGGSVSAKGDLVFKPTGVEFSGGAMEITLKGTVGKEIPLTAAIPAIQPALVFARGLAPSAMAKFEKMATIKLELGPNIASSFEFEKDSVQGWRFKDAYNSIGAGFKVTAKFEPVKDMISVSGGVGGELTLKLHVPINAQNPEYLTQAELKFVAEFALQAWKFATVGESVFSCTYTPQKGVVCSDENVTSADALAWQAIDRAYLTASNYSAWHITDGTYTGPILANVAALAKPVSYREESWQPGYLMWSWERPGSDINNGDELAFATGNDENFSVLTNDTRSDWNPQPMKVGSGTLVVWQRMDTDAPGDFNADPAAYFGHMQIAAGTFTETLASPTLAATQISASGSLNYRPSLVPWQNKKSIALWINNSGNQLVGDSTHPDQFMFAIGAYDNTSRQTTFGVPQNALPAIPGVIDYSFSSDYDDGSNDWTAGLLYVADTDGDPETLTDVELFYAYYSEETSAWSAPVQLTHNSIAESDPMANLMEKFNGMTTELYWRSGDQILSLVDDLGATPVVLPATLDNQSGPLQFVAEPSNDGFALIWPQADQVAVMFREDRESAWSYPTYVTPDATRDNIVTWVEGGFEYVDQQYNLQLVSQVEVTQPQTETVGGIAVPNVPVLAQRDVMSTTVMQGDVELAIVEPIVVAAAAAEGTSGDASYAVDVTIANLGSRVVQTVSVGIVQSNLVGQGVLLAEISVPDLMGYETRHTTINVTVPATGDFTLMARVKAKASNGYSDAAPAYATFPIDAALESAPTEYGANATIASIWLGQAGKPRHSPVVPLIVTRDSPDGAVVATLSGRPPVTGTQSVLVGAYISPTLLGPGSHTLYWRVDDTLIHDTNSANNWTSTLVQVLPDLHIDPNFLELDGGEIRALVTNRGNWPSVATTAELWSAPPDVAGRTKLASVVVPALQPGQTVLVSSVVTAVSAEGEAGRGVYFVLDPQNLVAEINENDSAYAPVIPSDGAPMNKHMYLPVVTR